MAESNEFIMTLTKMLGQDKDAVIKKIEGLGVDEEAFLKYLAVKSLSELTKPVLVKANASLDAKAKKIQKGGAA